MRHSLAVLFSVCLFTVACGKDGGGDTNTPIPTPTPTTTPQSCPGPDPAGAGSLVVPVATAPNGEVLHWCAAEFPIEVTYDPAAAASLTEINAALADWESVTCSPVAFNTPVEQTGSPSGQDRRIHFEILPDSAATASQTNNNFLSNTGEILHSLVEFKATSTVVNRVHIGVGQALGLAIAPNGTESVMAADYGGTAIASEDTVSLCYIYPSST